MNFATLATLTAILLAVCIALARVPPRHRRWVLLLLVLPGAILLYRWASYRGAWIELSLSLVASLTLLALWWFTLGRRLPPPHEGDIRVWSKDDPF